MAHSKSNTVYLVIGANKGIGLGIVKALLAKPGCTVIATVRDDTKSKALEEEIAKAPKGAGSALHVFQVDLSSAPDAASLRSRVEAEVAPLTSHVDVFISSVGFTTTLTAALDTTPQALRDHFEVNTIGPLVMFQAFWPLLKRSAAPPKAVFLSSSVGGIAQMEPMTGGAYGASKAALNWITRRLHFELEQDRLISVAVHPGWVQTEMGDLAAQSWGYPGKPPMTVEQSAAGVVQLIDNATRESSSGKFLSYDGTEMAW